MALPGAADRYHNCHRRSTLFVGANPKLALLAAVDRDRYHNCRRQSTLFVGARYSMNDDYPSFSRENYGIKACKGAIRGLPRRHRPHRDL